MFDYYLATKSPIEGIIFKIDLWRITPDWGSYKYPPNRPLNIIGIMAALMKVEKKVLKTTAAFYLVLVSNLWNLLRTSMLFSMAEFVRVRIKAAMTLSVSKPADFTAKLKHFLLISFVVRIYLIIIHEIQLTFFKRITLK